MTLSLRASLGVILLAMTCVSGVSAQTAGRVGAAVTMIKPSKSDIIHLPASDVGAIGRLDGKKVANSTCPIAKGEPSQCPVTPKFIGGKPAPDALYGFVVAIYYNAADGQRHICTGTLISERLVLTAGHCGCGIAGTYTVDFRQDARSGDLRKIQNVAGAPLLYDQRVCQTGDLSGGRDLALIRLTAPVAEVKRIAGYGFSQDLIWDLRPKLPTGKKLIAIGYGYTESGQLGVRMYGEIPIFSADCTGRNVAGVCAPFAEMILAEAPGPGLRKDTCGGDSGGPVFLDDGNQLKLIAVTSRAAPGLQDDPVHHCGGGGIYALIGRQSVQDWLLASGASTAGQPTTGTTQ